MDLGLKGKVAIVTGGSGPNMGSEFCLTFAQEGANVVVVGTTEERIQKVTEECQALGVKALGLKVDVTKIEETETMAKKVIDTFGQIDILVNSAYVHGPFARFLKLDHKIWPTLVDSIYYGALNCTRAVLPYMVERKSGRVISIGSDAARVGAVDEPVYAGAKGAIIAWSKSLALDQGYNNITFNVVSPSLTLRPDLAKERLGEETLKEITRRFYPLRKIGVPQDVAAMVVFLASEKGGNITGQTISVNGGYSMV